MTDENQILASMIRKSDTISRLLVNASYKFFMFIMSIYSCGLAMTAANLLQVQQVSKPKLQNGKHLIERWFICVLWNT